MRKKADRSAAAPSADELPAPAEPAFGGHVVCVGASAGGLDALERFFGACPTDTGAAFVVIQHLSPDHKSMMNNLLARHTRMPIIMVEDGMALAPNHVYLIPPGSVMHVNAPGHLHLTPKVSRGLTLPIDIFFASLAEHYGNKAVGIILSGTGTDGTRGAVAINAAGGFLMAQEPESSKFDGMPRSVITTGLVDAVLPAEELPERLVAHVGDVPAERPAAKIPLPSAQMPATEVFAAILRLLHQAGGIDFADYKHGTIMRRIERRMQVRHIPELHRYLDLLGNDHAEVLTLRREMLISVTSFFRDPEVFDLLAKKVIAPMVEALPVDGSIRVWVAGVATGEEAYSIGMLFLEAFDALKRWPSLKIFATDADQHCIESASIGQYSESAAVEIAPERLERYFVRRGDAFVVKNELRQCIVFARHNLLTDPPFTRMDLVACRNTLIYFKTGAQERALRSLQYAVKNAGVLLLGSSESLSGMADGMTAISAKHKLFRRTSPSSIPMTDRRSAAAGYQPASSATRERIRRRSSSLAELALATLMHGYAPPALIVNERREIVHIFGDMAPYLETREGSASLEINRQLPERLVPVASALLFKAERERLHLASDAVEFIGRDHSRRTVRLSSYPLDIEGEDRMCLLCFENVTADAVTPLPVDIDAETVARITQLERELAATRENLQATIEELETSNEELGTVNAEFQEKMLILNRANADLEGMGRAVGVATIFVDDQMQVTRFTPDATKIFKLREGDIGRRLDDISHALAYPTLMEDIGTTLTAGRLHECEVSGAGGAIYLTRILPYSVPASTLHGAVLTFIDVTAFHDARRLQSVVDALPEHIAVLDNAGTILVVNAAWRRFARANGDTALTRCGPGVNYFDVCATSGADGDSAAAAVRGLRRVLEGSDAGFSIEYPCHSTSEQRWFVMNVAPVRQEPFGAVVSHVDITAWRAGIDRGSAR